MKAKAEYDALLNSGDLIDLYPGLTANWQKDKKIFTRMWEQNMEVINGLYVDIDLDEDIEDYSYE